MDKEKNIKQHGANTREIVKKLKKKLDADPQRYKGLMVFNDHGESSKSGGCKLNTYMGRHYGNDATLSAVDIIITKNSKVILAVEVEESSVRPKTVIGDIFGVAIAERIRIQGK